MFELPPPGPRQKIAQLNFKWQFEVPGDDSRPFLVQGAILKKLPVYDQVEELSKPDILEAATGNTSPLGLEGCIGLFIIPPLLIPANGFKSGL